MGYAAASRTAEWVDDRAPSRVAVIDGLRTLAAREREVAIDKIALVALAADAYGWVDEVAPVTAAGALYGERLWAFGADGTPEVAEFLTHEVGPALGISPQEAASLIGDVLDLRHRHPLAWELMFDGYLPVWVARRVAQLVASRGLGLDQALELDRRLAPLAAGRGPRAIFAECERLCDAIDPEGAERRRRDALADRHVTFRPADGGVVDLLGRLDGIPGVALERTIDDLADAIADTPEGPVDDALVPCAETGRRLRRARALELLADPVRAAALLARTGEPAPAGGARVELVVHVTPGDVALGAGGTVTGLGSVARSQLDGLLTGARVTVRPVIDLRAPIVTDSYAPTPSQRRAVLLRDPVVAFPHATRASTSRLVDLDHVVPWPAGPTSTDNLAPFDRRTHRAKTHAGFRVETVSAGLLRWTTPTGQTYWVTPHGTFDRDPRDALVIDRQRTLRRIRLAARTARREATAELRRRARRLAADVHARLNPSLPGAA